MPSLTSRPSTSSLATTIPPLSRRASTATLASTTTTILPPPAYRTNHTTSTDTLPLSLSASTALAPPPYSRTTPTPASAPTQRNPSTILANYYASNPYGLPSSPSGAGGMRGRMRRDEVTGEWQREIVALPPTPRKAGSETWGERIEREARRVGRAIRAAHTLRTEGQINPTGRRM